MANQWLRLWHDMPNDPKWRTVARISKQPVSLVLAVFLHLMVDASRAVTRGHAGVTHEDLASALDCDEQQISAILEAMQGRVLDGMTLIGWDKRQPKREDFGDEERGIKSPAKRKQEQRQREDHAIDYIAETVFDDMCDMGELEQCHAVSHAVTLDKDKDKEEEVSKDTLSTECPSTTPFPKNDPVPNCPHAELIELFGKNLPTLAQPKIELWDGARAEAMRARWRWVMTAKKKSGARYATTKAEALAWFDRFFAYVEKSDFLSGRSGKWTSCDLGWLVKAENFAKVVQGNYENKEAA